MEGGLALLLGLLLSFSSTHAQQSTPISSVAPTVTGGGLTAPGGSQGRAMTLDEALSLALGRSFEFYAYGQHLVESAYRLEEARRGAGFQLTLNSQLPRRTQDIQISEFTDDLGRLVLSYTDVEQTRLASSLELGRYLPTGGWIALRSGISGVSQISTSVLDEDEDQESRTIRLVHPRLGVRFSQPFFAFNETRARIREAELSLERAHLGYSEQELREVSRVTAAYYGLVREQGLLRAAREMESETSRVAEIGERRFEVGLIPEVDRYALQLARSQAGTRILEMEQTLAQRRLELARMLGLPLEGGIAADPDTAFRPVFVDAGLAVGRALENRSDRRRAELAVEEALLELERIRGEGRPQLALNLSYDLGGVSTRTAQREGSWADQFDAAFLPENTFPFSSISLILEFPLYDSGEHRSALLREQTRLETARRRTEEVEVELELAVRRLGTAVNTLSRLGEEYGQNRVRAREYYTITSRLFEAGEAGSTELLLALQRHIEAEEDYLEALAELEISKALLRELTLWDWDTNQPVALRSEIPTIAW